MSALENDFLALCRLMHLPEPEREHRFMLTRKFRFDFAWPDLKIAVELDGGMRARTVHKRLGNGLMIPVRVRGRHVSASGFESDARKRNFAVIAGWRVLHFTAGMIRSGEAVRTVMEAIGIEKPFQARPARPKGGSLSDDALVHPASGNAGRT